MNSAGGDIHELRSLSEKVGQLEARRDAIVAENGAVALINKHQIDLWRRSDLREVLSKIYRYQK